MLSPEERIRLEDAVRRAEIGTAGEIVLVLSRRAARYRSVPLLAALVAAILVPPALLLGTELPAARIFVLQLAAMLLALLAASPEPVRIRLAPPSLKRARAREAASREFSARGLAETRGRTGILLYVAAAEGYAEVIGDVAIARRVAEAEWRAVIEDLVPALASGRTLEGLEAAVARMGAILTREVPAGGADPDELPNRIVLV